MTSETSRIASENYPTNTEKSIIRMVDDFYPPPGYEVGICDFDVTTGDKTVRVTAHVQGGHCIIVALEPHEPCYIPITEWKRRMQRALQFHVSASYGSHGCPPFWSRGREKLKDGSTWPTTHGRFGPESDEEEEEVID